MAESHAKGCESDAAGANKGEVAERIRVLLPLPLGEPYDYLAGRDMVLGRGDIVIVPLAGRRVVGAVWDDDRPPPPEERLPRARLKAVEAQVPVPPLPEVHRRFVDWVAAYTMSPPGTILRMTLSVSEVFEAPKTRRLVRRTDGAPAAGPRLTAARRRVLEACADGAPRAPAELARDAGVSSAVVKGLVEAGLLESVEVPRDRPFAALDPQAPGPLLSPDQRAAAELIRQRAAGGFSVTLLDGVTGSGKTEVYFEAIAEALRAGRQVLVLLPEIALSAQWLARFGARFGGEPGLWHSELSQAERRRTWRAVAAGEARLVVGARSALFLPFADLGLVVVDEEHESAFKQEEGVAYQARDMAIVRAHLAGIPAVLASATPSLESVVNVQRGRYYRIELPERHASAELPEVALVDMRRERCEPVAAPDGRRLRSWLSPTLRRAVAETLASGEQALLFLNRRGYAPLTLCRACGGRLQCPNCTAWLVEHRLVRRLQCHHCGYAAAMPTACPSCGAAGTLDACGPGVERVAEEVAALFPDARQAILASDTLATPGMAAEMVRAIQAREIDMLVGTQIVAKGHHFPYLTLVGVIDADVGLFGGDLRAAERTYQLLHQVAGRSGRAEHPGQALIQTAEPEHPVMQTLLSGDRDRFYQLEAESRKRAGLPPFGRLAALVLSAGSAAEVDESARLLARMAPRGEGVTVLGPAPAPLAVLRGRHRRRFLLKVARGRQPQPILERWLGRLDLPRQVRVQIDIDPYSFL